MSKKCKLKKEYHNIQDALYDYWDATLDYLRSPGQNCIEYYIDVDRPIQDIEKQVTDIRFGDDGEFNLDTDLTDSTFYQLSDNGEGYGEMIDNYESEFGKGAFGEAVKRWRANRALNAAVALYCENVVQDFINFAFDIEEEKPQK